MFCNIISIPEELTQVVLKRELEPTSYWIACNMLQLMSVKQNI